LTRLLIALLILWLSLPAMAHEVRPAYLELREQAEGEFQVLWKTPMRGELRLALTPEFSAASVQTGPVASRLTGDAAVQTWRISTSESLRGTSIFVAGLAASMTDVLVRIQFADGADWTQRLTPVQPSANIPVRNSGLAVMALYLKLGVEHILLGIDHLLFVFALLLITNGGWRLVKTITAFTLAHSITLALASLKMVHLPQPPVEAVIALSIAFLAAEIVRAERGHLSLTYRSPWILAFIFGLAHGFGFAGALLEIGLPQGQIPVALLFFNVGVELGQLLFVAVVVSLFKLVRYSGISLSATGRFVAPYAIGSLAMFWVIQRVVSF